MKKNVLIIFLILLSLTYNTVFADNNTDYTIKASRYIDRYYANIHSEGNGDISIWFEVEATGIMDEIGALSIRLQQRSNSSSTWSTIKTYSYTNYSNMLKNDKRLHISNVDYSGIPGYSRDLAFAI